VEQPIKIGGLPFQLAIDFCRQPEEKIIQTHPICISLRINQCNLKNRTICRPSLFEVTKPFCIDCNTIFQAIVIRRNGMANQANILVFQRPIIAFKLGNFTQYIQEIKS
jgi:hypothetical protein